MNAASLPVDATGQIAACRRRPPFLAFSCAFASEHN
jgi:hypothetical protein